MDKINTKFRNLDRGDVAVASGLVGAVAVAVMATGLILNSLVFMGGSVAVGVVAAGLAFVSPRH